jgi:IS1 family transposase
MVFCRKKQKNCLPTELETGDCWIAISLAQLSGLILSGRIGKHTDELAAELVTSTEGKTECREWHTDGWSSYERVLPSQVEHYVSKALTQRVERTNGTLRQQTGRWHRRQNKFSKLWPQTELTVRLVVTYFNWIWRHSCLGTTAAQRAELTDRAWTWNDIAAYPTLL